MQEFATQHHLIAWCPAWKPPPGVCADPILLLQPLVTLSRQADNGTFELISWGWQRCSPQLIPLRGLEMLHSGAFLLQMPRVKSKASSAFSLLLLCPRREHWMVLLVRPGLPQSTHPSLLPPNRSPEPLSPVPGMPSVPYLGLSKRCPLSKSQQSPTQLSYSLMREVEKK